MRIIFLFCSLLLSFSLSAKEFRTFQDLFEYLGPHNPLVIDIDKKSKSASNIEKINDKLVYKNAYDTPSDATIIDKGSYYSVSLNSNVSTNPFNIFYQFTLDDDIGKVVINYIKGQVIRIEIIHFFEKKDFTDEDRDELNDLIVFKLSNMGFVKLDKDNVLNKVFFMSKSNLYIKDDIVVSVYKASRPNSIITTIVKKDYQTQLDAIYKTINKQEQDSNKQKITKFYQ